jgi:hypothetical protein
MPVAAAKIALRVEDVAVEPDVRIGQPIAAPAGVGQDLERSGGVTAGCGYQGQPARRHPLPTRVAELAGTREGLAQ